MIDPTDAQVNAAFQMVRVVADALRELGRVPSGEFYVRVMPHMTIQTYDKIIGMLKGAKLIEEKNHELIWIGPKESK